MNGHFYKSEDKNYQTFKENYIFKNHFIEDLDLENIHAKLKTQDKNILKLKTRKMELSGSRLSRSGSEIVTSV